MGWCLWGRTESDTTGADLAAAVAAVDFGSYDIAALDLLLCLPTLTGCQLINYQVQAEDTIPFKVSK